MNKIIFNFIGNIKFSIIIFSIIAGFSQISAQTSLEMFSKTSNPANPTGNGPVQSTTIYLQDNTDNPTGNTVAAANNPVSVTYTLSNHAYTYNNNPVGTNFMTNIGVMLGTGSAIYPIMNAYSGPINSYYTAGNIAGQGIDVAVNRYVNLFTYVYPLYANNVNVTSRGRVFDLTLAFSRPVDNPVLHLADMGAGVANASYSLEFNVLGGHTLTRLSGNSTTSFVVENNNQINNNSATFIPNTFGYGSARVNGTDISTLTIEVYIDGADNNTSWSNSREHGEFLGIAVSLPQNVLVANNDTYSGGKQGTLVTTASVLGNDTFNGGAATTTNVTLSGKTVPTGFTLNANGTITKAANVTAGTYSIAYEICDKAEAGNCKSATATITVLEDSDGDGITDDIDIDDDNDGILDTVELSCSNQFDAGWFSNSPHGTYTQDGVWLTPNDGGASLTYGGAHDNAIIASAQNISFGNGFTVSNSGNSWDIVNIDAATYNVAVTNNEYVQYQFTTPAIGTFPNNANVVLDRIGLANHGLFKNYYLGAAISTNNFATNTILVQNEFMNTEWGSGFIYVTYNPSIPYKLLPNTTYTIRVYLYNVNGGSTETIKYDDFQFGTCVQKDTDGDSILDYLDLDSDNDGCPDAIEGGANITLSQLVSSAGTVSVGTGSTASNQNLCGGTTCVNAQGLPQFTTVPTNYSNTTGQAGGTSYVSNPQAVAGTVSANQLITSGATPSPISITGSTGAIQWQTSSDNINFTNISGATNATYSPGALSSTTYYRAVLTNAGGCSVNSNVITIAIDSDGDRIADNTDIDDDNDGIADAEECKYCSGGGTPFGNGGFESPNFAGTTYAYIGASSVPNWSTTASTNQIELWKSGFNGVPAAEGNQFAELNANEVSTLYQVFCIPLAGGTLNWSIKHRGRNGTDVAEVRLGTGLTTYNVLATMSDGNTAWGSYSGTVNIPANNSGTYYIMFASVSAAGGNAGVGNFLDDIQINIIPNCPDTDGDGIPNNLDLDSDNDGCLDAIEGGADIKLSQLVNRAGIVSVGTGSTASNQNLCGGTSCVNVEGLPQFTTVPTNYNNSTGQTTDISQDASIGANACKCFKAGATGGTVLNINHGITTLGRAGNDNDGNAANDWPMVRKGAWTALEGKSKGFVINRIPTTAQVNAIPDAVEGMMVYDEQADCLKIYTKDDAPATTSSWRCFNTQTCPDVL